MNQYIQRYVVQHIREHHSEQLGSMHPVELLKFSGFHSLLGGDDKAEVLKDLRRLADLEKFKVLHRSCSWAGFEEPKQVQWSIR